MQNIILLNSGNIEDDAALGTVEEQRKRIIDLVTQASDEGKPLVIYYHGGLVPKDAGIQSSETIFPYIQNAGGVPISFVWQSGLLETLRNNLSDIVDKEFYGKIFDVLLAKLEDHLQINAELAPDADRGIGADVQEFAPLQQAVFRAALEQSADIWSISRSLWEAAKTLAPAGQVDNAQNLRTVAAVAGPADDEYISLIAQLPEDFLLDEANAAHEPGARSILGAVSIKAKVIEAVIQITMRVVSRYLQGTFHGLHATIVEEILRHLYGAVFGSTIWSMMKNDTEEAFGDIDQDAGGSLLLEALAKVSPRPRVVILGHSAGCIFAAHTLLNDESDAQFDLIFLAPAITFELFHTVVEQHPSKIANFRMFTMRDEQEREDALINDYPFLYPSSLLYIVSGLFETTADGEGEEIDKPLLGMERFYLDDYVIKDGQNELVATVRDFINEEGLNHVIWTPTDGAAPQGARSKAVDHGNFNEEEETLESVKHIIQQGFNI